MRGYHCATCGQHHDELPLTFAADAPLAYLELPEPERDDRALLSSDQCIIDGERFFIRGQLELPILGSASHFTWGVWVEVSAADFDAMDELWEREGREAAAQPYGVRLATRLSVYAATTLGLPARLVTRPVGLRPAVVLKPSGHALFIEQRDGVTWERVRGIASACLHGSS